jgi:hypothetical protein
MSLLGKLLIVFNLLAGCGFLYLATQDWKGRQTIAAGALRHKLPLVGLPFEGPDNFDPEDETPFQIEMAGGVSTQTVSKKILELYFQAAPGGEPTTTLGDKAPVPSQLAEIRRVKAKIQTLLGDKSDVEKLALLKDWLIDQSETLDQRQEVQALIKAGNYPEMEKRLIALFDAVLAPPTILPPDAISKLKEDEANDPGKVEQKLAQIGETRTKTLDGVERQVRAAKLLVHLSQDAAWQKRVMLIVGLRRYVNVVAAQAVRFQDMSARLDALLISDQLAYLGQEAVYNQLARDRTELANHQSKLKAEKVEQKNKEDNFIGQRQTQLKKIQTQLLKIKAEVDEALVKQGQIEAGLFEIQREVAITLDEVYQLEAMLAQRERDLFKLNPPSKAPPSTR